MAATACFRSAVISACGKYRYYLCRNIAGGGGRAATFIMLNPSTADAECDDPTIRKCVGFARTWGCGLLHVVNLFGFRATQPTELRTVRNPVGSRNREFVQRAVGMTDGPVVCAWGIHGGYLAQDEIVLGWIDGLCDPVCFGVTAKGHPRHPLYVSYTAELRPLVINAV
jgi:hypothetical protein